MTHRVSALQGAGSPRRGWCQRCTPRQGHGRSSSAGRSGSGAALGLRARPGRAGPGAGGRGAAERGALLPPAGQRPPSTRRGRGLRATGCAALPPLGTARCLRSPHSVPVLFLTRLKSSCTCNHAARWEPRRVPIVAIVTCRSGLRQGWCWGVTAEVIRSSLCSNPSCHHWPFPALMQWSLRTLLFTGPSSPDLS